MKILVSNDDGIQSSGLQLLVKYLGRKNQVYVVAPDSQRSGFSHSMTFRRPMFLNKIQMDGAKEAYSFSGTPADCVRFGLQFLKIEPDMVIAGPNIGPNLTFDVHYSGTIGAACEGAIYGYKSIALSCAVPHNKEAVALFDATCSFVEEKLSTLYSFDYRHRFLNINVPNVEKSEIKGVKVVPYGKKMFEDIYERYESPDDGKIGYCLGGDFIAFEKQEESDAYYIGQNFITITPLITDLCDYEAIETLKGKL